MKTGNTHVGAGRAAHQGRASMEPGHEDREYAPNGNTRTPRPRQASMEPGHEDREYIVSSSPSGSRSGCLNGARS